MFNPIPPAVQRRMAYLEEIDAQDRQDGTPRQRRLRQIPPETGRFLALMAALAPAGPVLEVGASGGYSGLWLALACRQRGDRLTTFELDPAKAQVARETFRLAGVESQAQVVEGDALARLPAIRSAAFCFVDTEKELYEACFDLITPMLVSGGLLLMDNAVSHAYDLRAVLEKAQSDPRLDALVVPVGKGVLVCRKV